jgi:serine protease Do
VKRALLVAACLASLLVGAWFGSSQLTGQAPSTAPVKPRDITSYRDIVKRVLPGVVSVEALSRAARADGRNDDGRVPVDDDDPERVGFGSGFFLAKGVVVTNNHVLEGAESARIRTADGRRITSSKIRRDAKTDLAILLIDPKDATPTLEFGDSDSMEIGDRVLAVGAPFGLTGTVTSGIISSKGRSLKMNMYEDFLQTDAAINPGNSGGPLVNLEGKVIGVNSAIKSRTGGFQGIGLAISANLAKSIVETLLRDGVVKRGYLGVGIRDVTDDIAKEAKLSAVSGVQVTRVYPDAPGDKAGLRTGDVIDQIAGRAIKDGRSLQGVVAGLPLNKAVEVRIYREGKAKALSVTVEEQPRAFGTTKRPTIPTPGRGATMVEKAGVALAELTPELADALDFPEDARGALVTQIVKGGVAFKAGIQPGELILSVAKEKTPTARAAVKALNEASLREGVAVQLKGARTPTRTVTLRTEKGSL